MSALGLIRPGVLVRFVAALFISVAAPHATASCYSSLGPPDWTFATTGVNGSSGIELHNGNQMAWVYHAGGHGSNYGSSTTSSSLSCTLDYSASQTLAFDMHPVAVFLGAHAGAGVRIDLLNVFNVSLGSAGLYHYTNPALLGPNEFLVSNTQQHFEAPMSDFATLAGVNPATPAKLSLTFLGWSNFSGGGNIYPNDTGTATVHFNVGVVPEPTSMILMSLGLGLLSWFRRGQPRR
jgi:hypothetical protein